MGQGEPTHPDPAQVKVRACVSACVHAGWGGVTGGTVGKMSHDKDLEWQTKLCGIFFIKTLNPLKN